MTRIKISIGVVPNVCDHRHELFIVVVVEKMRQSHCPIKPGGYYFHIFGFISGDDVLHCQNVATGSDCDCLA